MDDNKIHITVTDPDTRNAITHRFDTWLEAWKFCDEQKRAEEKQEQGDGSDNVQA